MFCLMNRYFKNIELYYRKSVDALTVFDNIRILFKYMGYY